MQSDRCPIPPRENAISPNIENSPCAAATTSGCKSRRAGLSTSQLLGCSHPSTVRTHRSPSAWAVALPTSPKLSTWQSSIAAPRSKHEMPKISRTGRRGDAGRDWPAPPRREDGRGKVRRRSRPVPPSRNANAHEHATLTAPAPNRLTHADLRARCEVLPSSSRRPTLQNHHTHPRHHVAENQHADPPRSLFGDPPSPSHFPPPFPTELAASFSQHAPPHEAPRFSQTFSPRFVWPRATTEYNFQ